jgi:hypothetical protein
MKGKVEVVIDNIFIWNKVTSMENVIRSFVICNINLLLVAQLYQGLRHVTHAGE